MCTWTSFSLTLRNIGQISYIYQYFLKNWHKTLFSYFASEEQNHLAQLQSPDFLGIWLRKAMYINRLKDFFIFYKYNYTLFQNNVHVHVHNHVVIKKKETQRDLLKKRCKNQLIFNCQLRILCIYRYHNWEEKKILDN